MSSVSYGPRDSSDGDEISLAFVWHVLWGHRWLIALCVAICGAIAVVLALTAIPIFRAQVVVTETREQGATGGSTLASQLGNLAGVNIRSSSASQESLALLRSRRLAEEFISRRELVPLLAPSEPGRQTLWWAALRFTQEVLFISEDTAAGTITVAVEWTDPQTASEWANDFVALANELMRMRAMDEATRSISYLEKQLERTDVVEVERALYNLIEAETKTLMLTNARIEYSFKVIDPSRPPEFRTRPQRTTMVMFGGFVGLLIGAIAAFAYSAYTKSRAARVGA
jgi:uncharacterized protein involved in exopolysaccharide biosynthesis